jgi:hypothetical protein
MTDDARIPRKHKIDVVHSGPPKKRVIYTYICEDIWYKGKHHDAKKHYNNKPETVI